MKGNVRITVEITHDDNFPITETYIISQDNTYEAISEWINVFKKILYCADFDNETIEEVFNEEV